MTGRELRDLLVAKWGYSYDVQLRKLPRKIFFQVMWRYLEQASFPMEEQEYIAHLDEVVAYLNDWGAAAQVQTFIEQTSDRPRLGKAVSMPIDLGPRGSEWLLDEG